MTTSVAPVTLLSNITNSTQCFSYDVISQKYFTFDSYQLVRVIVTWVLFVLSVVGNIFVLISIGGQREKWSNNYIVMFNVALADLLYACTVLPIDGVWNITMQWYGGDALCRIMQMLKQVGMYASANMVMVIGITRAWTLIRSPRYMTRRQTNIFVRSAWVMSVICSVPGGIFFSVWQIHTCEGVVMTQCVDNVTFPKGYLHTYHFFTLVMSFLLPFFVTIISGAIIVNAITLMKNNQPSVQDPRESLDKAIVITTGMKTAITVTFLICWTPYYASGIIYWFGLQQSTETHILIYRITYLMLYLNCFLHPIIFGLFTKKVKQNFVACLYPIKKRMECSKNCPDLNANQQQLMSRVTQDRSSISNDQTKLMTTDEQSV